MRTEFIIWAAHRKNGWKSNGKEGGKWKLNSWTRRSPKNAKIFPFICEIGRGETDGCLCMTIFSIFGNVKEKHDFFRVFLQYQRLTGDATREDYGGEGFCRQRIFFCSSHKNVTATSKCMSLGNAGTNGRYRQLLLSCLFLSRVFYIGKKWWKALKSKIISIKIT